MSCFHSFSFVFLARANAQCRRKAAGGMQVVAKPHQRAHTTQQEACLLCVSITSDCILKLKHQKRFTSCLKIHINSVTCFGFYWSQRGVHCCQFHYMALEGVSLPEGLIVRDKSVLAANRCCSHWKLGSTKTGKEEVGCYLAAPPPLTDLFLLLRLPWLKPIFQPWARPSVLSGGSGGEKAELFLFLFLFALNDTDGKMLFQFVRKSRPSEKMGRNKIRAAAFRG